MFEDANDPAENIDQGQDDEDCGPVDGPMLYNEVFLARTKGTSSYYHLRILFIFTLQLEGIIRRPSGHLVNRLSRRTLLISFDNSSTHKFTQTKTSTQPHLLFDSALRSGMSPGYPSSTPHALCSVHQATHAELEACIVR